MFNDFVIRILATEKEAEQIQGMSVKEIGTISKEEEAKLYKSPEGYGIPFGKVGTARDYAQLILMVVNVSLFYFSSRIVADGAEPIHDWIRTLD